MSTPPRRRLLAACVAAVALMVPFLGSTSASGDAIGDKRGEAQRIAAQIERLRAQAEMAAEQYNAAKVELGSLEKKVAASSADLRRTRAVTEQRRRELTRYAVGEYTTGQQDGLALILPDSGAEAAKREGYSRAALGNRADLVDALEAATSDGEAKVARLRRSRDAADRARAEMAKKGKEAAAATARGEKLLERVQGELKFMVATEQARRAAAEARRAEAATRRLEAATRRLEAAPRRVETSARGGDAVRVRRSGSTRSLRRSSSSSSASAPVPAVGQGAGAAIAAARSQLGVPYHWAGSSPSTGFDCSGLTSWAWGRAGKSLPHSSTSQYSMARKIPLSALQPGDLVFYGSPIHHVALYIGGGQIIHAPHTGDVVKIASMNLSGDIVGGGRV